MAKKNGITISDALIPKDDYPYDVPNNWCWVKLGAISSIISKGTTPKGGKSAYVDEGIDFLRVENINDDGTICHDNMMHVTEETHTGFLKRSMLEENDVLVSIAGTLGKTAIVKKDDLPLNTNQAVAFVRLADNGEISRDFIRYAIDTPVIQNMLLAKTKVTAIPNLTLEIISDCLIPLPPLAEQKRIVEQIENLFSMLDEAKEKAQEALESISNRKSAILVNAFSGKLTEKWRNKKGYNIDSWESCKISDVFDLKAGKNISATKIVEEQDATHRYQCFGGNGVRGYVEEYNQDGDFCIIGRQGALCGNINVARGQFYATEHAVLVKYKKPVYLLWAEHYLRYMNLNQYATSVAQPGLAVGKINEVPMIYVPYEEQCEIGNNIESLFTKEDSVKANIEVVIEKIEILKKTILAKAFRGELGTNNPDEERSIELLRRMVEGVDD